MASPVADDSALDIEAEGKTPPVKRKTIVPGGLAHFFGGKKTSSAHGKPPLDPRASKPRSPRSGSGDAAASDYDERMRMLRMQTELEIIKERLAKAEQERKELEALTAQADDMSVDVAARLKIETTGREDSTEEALRSEIAKQQHRSLASSGYTGFAGESKTAADDESDDEEKSGKNSRSSSRTGSQTGSVKQR